MINATLKIRRDGLAWREFHWIVETKIDDPCWPPSRIVDIQDGTDDLPPLYAFYLEDRQTA